MLVMQGRPLPLTQLHPIVILDLTRLFEELLPLRHEPILIDGEFG
jgi:hypothetical protein